MTKYTVLSNDMSSRAVGVIIDGNFCNYMSKDELQCILNEHELRTQSEIMQKLNEVGK